MKKITCKLFLFFSALGIWAIVPMHASDRGLLVVGQLPINESEVMITTRMAEKFAIDMVPVLAPEVSDLDADRAALVFVACTTQSGDLEGDFLATETPVINAEGWNYDDFLMTGDVYGEDYGCYQLGRWGFIQEPQTHVIIHEITQFPELGAEPVAVYPEPLQMIYGRALPSAKVWAVADHETGHAVVFTYEKGDEDSRGEAFPGKRAGFFVYNDTAKNLTEEGWYLFDQLMAWALE